MSDEDAAIEALNELGLTEYEAKCFVALTRIAQGTAKEISQLSDVPRSRVYDTVDRLHEKGLVDIQQSDPREYRAVSKEDAFEKLRSDYHDTIEAADAALETVESSETQEDKGTWAIAGADHVSDRAMTLVEDANEHVHFIVADETVLEDEFLDALAAATDRAVSVFVEVPSESVHDRVQEAVPGARIVIARELRNTEEVVKKWPGQLMMVDYTAALVSGVEESKLPEVFKETALWSHGRNHGFAAWLRELLQDRVESTD